MPCEASAIGSGQPTDTAELRTIVRLVFSRSTGSRMPLANGQTLSLTASNFVLLIAFK
jgi:hypothetical protein